MDIVDMQLHEPAPFEDWAAADEETRRRVMTEALWQSIDSVGVGAVVINALEDHTWATELSHRFPERVATVPHFRRPDLDHHDLDGFIADIRAQQGVVALRLGAIPSLSADEFAFLDQGGFDPALAACERHGLPVWLEVMGGVQSVQRIARTFSGLQIVIDHMGINQPPYQRRDDPPWKDVPLVLALGRYENVAIKVCAPIDLSDESFPWTDAWHAMEQMLEAFGAARLAWASDIQRTRGRSGYQVRLLAPAAAEAPPQYLWGPEAFVPTAPPGGPDYPGKHTYMDSLAFFLYNDQLSDGEKQQILGKTTRLVHKWPTAHPSGGGD